MKRLHVLLLQLPVPDNAVTNVPLAAGYLKAYAHSQGLLEAVEIAILPRAIADQAGDALLIDQIVARAPDILGISLYTWNSERSLTIAAAVKQRLSGVRVLVGGPEVQRDNDWVLQHPAVDVAVIGEGEQTFVALLQSALESPDMFVPSALRAIPGIAFRDQDELVITPERVALADLSGIESPYLLGYLDLQPGGMLMVEVSRWCPYACSFCLYGRNMGTKLGNRYFSLERLLAEIRWGKAHGATSVHFIEANLNLVPLFRPLMAALADLNADGSLALYAELRGEHLTEEAVDSLAQAGLKVAEVGLQTANPVALRTAHRRTDLQKWAAGTRRLYAHGVDVLLDVILGLPADDVAGVEATLAFINAEALGAYDAFTLQILPGTAVRQQADDYAIGYQSRPPYYVLETNRFDYATLRRLRRELKLGAGIDPEVVDGCPEPRMQALSAGTEPESTAPITRLVLNEALTLPETQIAAWVNQLAAHVDLLAMDLPSAEAVLRPALSANPSTLFDLYLRCDSPPAPTELRDWRTTLPYQPGYLDRVAVFRRPTAEPQHDRVSPRIFLVLPWSSQIDPESYVPDAQVIWRYDVAAGEEAPLRSWQQAGGAGIWVPGLSATQAAIWSEAAGLRIWR